MTCGASDGMSLVECVIFTPVMKMHAYGLWCVCVCLRLDPGRLIFKIAVYVEGPATAPDWGHHIAL